MMLVEALAGGVLAALLLAWIVNQPDGFGLGRSKHHRVREVDVAHDDDFELDWNWPQ